MFQASALCQGRGPRANAWNINFKTINFDTIYVVNSVDNTKLPCCYIWLMIIVSCHSTLLKKNICWLQFNNTLFKVNLTIYNIWLKFINKEASFFNTSTTPINTTPVPIQTTSWKESSQLAMCRFRTKKTEKSYLNSHFHLDHQLLFQNLPLHLCHQLRVVGEEKAVD